MMRLTHQESYIALFLLSLEKRKFEPGVSKVVLPKHHRVEQLLTLVEQDPVSVP
jgi:hypothetical protein